MKMMVNHRNIKEALLIRRVEETFLDLFSKGKLNGTVHTCVGQEFSAVAFAGQLKKSDFIFSNHRCHGHYLSFTKDCYGLIAELMGKKTGASGGIGSSQHLCNNNFYSNGIQGGIVPVAAGYALANKLLENNNIGVVFIGDGTLGEGVLYETMNIISKWEIPLLIVCENNFYAQSTPQHINLSGSIEKRAEAFDIKTFKSTTFNVEDIIINAKSSIDYVRNTGKPCFHLVDTYRLNAHSKGDDDRDISEVATFGEKDFLNKLAKEDPETYNRYLQEINKKINGILKQVEDDNELTLDEYFTDKDENGSNEWVDLENEEKRQVELINQFFNEKMKNDGKTIFLGEDVLSPYGGAFKVAKNLSNNYPDRVFSTPISEAALVGISNGLAMAGFKPYAEIMFGDFVTLAMDQIINHASKFHHIYNGKASCPVVIRTPMGGKRGYGPTHSQTMDKFLVGIDNVTTVALNTLINPKILYEAVHTEAHPVIVIENKIDYGKKITNAKIKNFHIQRNLEKYPVIKITPVLAKPDITIVTYGGSAEWVTANANKFFTATDLVPEIIVLTKIHPINYKEILESVKKTKKLYFVEEGSKINGIGSEVIATVIERIDFFITAKRIGATPIPIPSVKSLEELVLPGIEMLVEVINNS
jgi:2-oxoisovalerate dehydrogenase E1 component